MNIKKKVYKSLSNIRNFQYKYKLDKNKKIFKVDISDFYKNPYTFFKSIYYIESSSLIIYFAQFTKITPNQLTFIYIILGVLGCLFLASNDDTLIIISSFFFFTKGSFDWADGSLAKIQKKTSSLGNLLDNWGALVGHYSFVIGFGIYIYNKESGIIFIFLILLIIFLKLIDIKNYAYQLFSIEFEIAKDKKNFLKKINFKNKYNFIKKKRSFLFLIQELFKSFIDDRSRTVDFILFLILLDSFYLDIFFLKYIFYYITFKTVVIFFGKIYVIINKNNIYN